MIHNACHGHEACCSLGIYSVDLIARQLSKNAIGMTDRVARQKRIGNDTEYPKFFQRDAIAK